MVRLRKVRLPVRLRMFVFWWFVYGKFVFWWFVYGKFVSSASSLLVGWWFVFWWFGWVFWWFVFWWFVFWRSSWHMSDVLCADPLSSSAVKTVPDDAGPLTTRFTPSAANFGSNFRHGSQKMLCSKQKQLTAEAADQMRCLRPTVLNDLSKRQVKAFTDDQLAALSGKQIVDALVQASAESVSFRLNFTSGSIPSGRSSHALAAMPRIVFGFC